MQELEQPLDASGPIARTTEYRPAAVAPTSAIDTATD